MHSVRHAIRASLLLAALWAGGCGADFAPASYLDGLRVLAIEAEPLEVGPGEQLRLEPFVYLPPDEEVTAQSWTFCPFTLGAQAGYACAVPECQQQLAAAADGALASQPFALALECAERFAGEQPPEGLPDELPERIEMSYRYRVSATSGAERQAVMRVPVYPQGADEPRNGPPRIAEVRIGGQPVSAGQRLAPVGAEDELMVRLAVEPGSMDSYTDAAGRELVEEPIVSLFASAGRFELERAAGLEVEVAWRAKKLEPDQTEAALYAVVRDLRGGQTVAGPYWIPILR